MAKPDYLSPPVSAVGDVAGRIRRVLHAPGIRELVAAYFDPAGPFVGTDLDQLGDNPPNRFTRDDLLAVSLLGISWSPPAVRRILGSDAPALASLLEPITDTDLWLADDALLTVAETAWTQLRHVGVGAVAAGKLLARKLPHLIPIVDRVILHALNPPRGRVWATLRACLQVDELRTQVDELRPEHLNHVCTLRLLDVAIWMRHSRSEVARKARLRAGTPEQDD